MYRPVHGGPGIISFMYRSSLDIFDIDPWEYFNFFTRPVSSALRAIRQLFADILRTEQTIGLLIAIVGILVILLQSLYERAMGREVAKHSIIVELLAIVLLFGIVTIFNLLASAVNGIVN